MKVDTGSKAKVAKLLHVAEDPQEMKDPEVHATMTGRMKSLFAMFQKLQ